MILNYIIANVVENQRTGASKLCTIIIVTHDCVGNVVLVICEVRLQELSFVEMDQCVEQILLRAVLESVGVNLSQLSNYKASINGYLCIGII